MQHNAPHRSSAFEGYYNKFLLPSGASMILIICKIKDAKEKPNKVAFTYIPQDVSRTFQKEVFPEHMNMRKLHASGDAFILDVPGMGYVKWLDDDTAEYHLEHDAYTFSAKTTTRTPWSPTINTPAGSLVHLPLPLQWHVHSLASIGTFDMQIPSYPLPSADTSGPTTVHQEKNWAFSFPSAHMWIQARDGDRGICAAGGQILRLDAFLLGYRSKNLNVDFRPPFAVRLLGWSPFMSYSLDWETRTFEISIQSFRQKIEVKAKAPVGSFFSLSPPFPEGHRENYLGQSLQARLEVKVFESGWFSPWELVREDVFEGGGLEFGAGYYPPAGSKQRFH